MLPRRRRNNSEGESSSDTHLQKGRASSQLNQTFYTSEIQSVPSIKSNNSEITLAMTCRDRTNEFMSAVKLIQGNQFHSNGVIKSTHSKRSQTLLEWKGFMAAARKIGHDIGRTFEKLEKLTILAKRKSLFDDKSKEIQELTYIIKQDIGSLNKQIAKLQEFEPLLQAESAANHAVESSDVVSRHVFQLARSKSQDTKHIKSHSNSVVVSLQSKLATMSNEFKEVLEVRTENLKHQKNRRDQFTQRAVTSNLPPSAMTGHSTGSVLLADERANNNSDFAINMDGAGSSGGFQSQQLQLIDEQESYVQSRADTMQNIESTIVELGGIFQQLAHMVKEQEEVVQRIDANVDDANINVEAAHSEILKYFQSVSSNRWLMIKVFGVLIIFFIIFVVFMA
ncbi:Syntaxin-5 [Nymphon striatum]|nr:Syntaxin-5 [Nymphon striatum]